MLLQNHCLDQRFLEHGKRICVLFQLDFEQKSMLMGKIPILPYLEGLDLKIQKYQAPNFTIETVLKLKIY